MDKISQKLNAAISDDVAGNTEVAFLKYLDSIQNIVKQLAKDRCIKQDGKIYVKRGAKLLQLFQHITQRLETLFSPSLVVLQEKQVRQSFIDKEPSSSQYEDDDLHIKNGANLNISKLKANLKDNKHNPLNQFNFKGTDIAQLPVSDTLGILQSPLQNLHDKMIKLMSKNQEKMNIGAVNNPNKRSVYENRYQHLAEGCEWIKNEINSAHSCDLVSIPVSNLVTQLSIIDAALLIRLSKKNFESLASNPTDTRFFDINCQALLNFSYYLTAIMQTRILIHSQDTSERASCISFAIKMSEEACSRNEFNVAYAFWAACSNEPVQRLHSLWKTALSPPILQIYNNLSLIFSPLQQFQKLRETLRRSSAIIEAEAFQFSMPYMGLFLSDLSHIDASFFKFGSEGFSELGVRRLDEIWRQIQNFQCQAQVFLKNCNPDIFLIHVLLSQNYVDETTLLKSAFDADILADSFGGLSLSSSDILQSNFELKDEDLACQLEQIQDPFTINSNVILTNSANKYNSVQKDILSERLEALNMHLESSFNFSSFDVPTKNLSNSNVLKDNPTLFKPMQENLEQDNIQINCHLEPANSKSEYMTFQYEENYDESFDNNSVEYNDDSFDKAENKDDTFTENEITLKVSQNFDHLTQSAGNIIKINALEVNFLNDNENDEHNILENQNDFLYNEPINDNHTVNWNEKDLNRHEQNNSLYLNDEYDNFTENTDKKIRSAFDVESYCLKSSKNSLHSFCLVDSGDFTDPSVSVNSNDFYIENLLSERENSATENKLIEEFSESNADAYNTQYVSKLLINDAPNGINFKDNSQFFIDEQLPPDIFSNISQEIPEFDESVKFSENKLPCANQPTIKPEYLSNYTYHSFDSNNVDLVTLTNNDILLKSTDSTIISNDDDMVLTTARNESIISIEGEIYGGDYSYYEFQSKQTCQPSSFVPLNIDDESINSAFEYIPMEVFHQFANPSMFTANYDKYNQFQYY